MEDAPDTEGSSALRSTFSFKDCALIAIATGRRAFAVKELRDHIATVSPASIYYHFWGSRLQPSFEEPEYNNNFAAWVWRGLHDPKLAERLAVIDPTPYRNLQGLREEVLDIIDERIDESESLPWVRSRIPFEFIRSQIVVFDTHRQVESPEELAEVIPDLSTGSIFYHFIDARRRLAEGIDDFRHWLAGREGDYEALNERLAQIDPYFSTLVELRQEVAAAFAGLGERSP